MKALTIIRVSSEDQRFGYGIDSQWEDDILASAPKLGLEVSQELRRDIEEPATGWNRERFTEAITEAIQLYQAGEIQAVIFPRVDRETRFIFSSMPLLSSMLQAGLQVYYAREELHLDPSDPEAVSSYLNKVGQSQAYIEVMRVNTMRGRRKRASKDGKLPTGRGVLFGYDYDPITGSNIANKNLDTVRMIGSWLIEDGIFLNEACRRLMEMGITAPKGGLIWSRGSLGRIMRNPTYVGKTVVYKTTGKARIPTPAKQIEMPNAIDKPAFNQDEWLAIQKQLNKNRDLSPRNQKHSYLLSGAIFCGQCGRRYYGLPVHGKTYYRCSGRIGLLSNTHCKNVTIKAPELEDDIWNGLQEWLRDPEMLLKGLKKQLADGSTIKHLEEQIKQNENRLKGIEDAEDRYLRLYGAGLYSFERLQRECLRIRAEKEKLERDNTEKQQLIQNANQAELAIESIEQATEFLNVHYNQFTLDKKRDLLRLLNLKVYIYPPSDNRAFQATIEGIFPIPDMSTLRHNNGQ